MCGDLEDVLKGGLPREYGEPPPPPPPMAATGESMQQQQGDFYTRLAPSPLYEAEETAGLVRGVRWHFWVLVCMPSASSQLTPRTVGWWTYLQF